MQDAPDTAQAEGESPDGADKPPHEGNRPGRSLNAHTTRDSRSVVPSDIVKSLRDGVKHVISPNLSASPNSYPLPPPEAGAFPKEPGYTKGDLGQIILQQANQRYEGAMTPSPSGSPEDSDDEDDFIDSAPSTRPNSRAPSMSYGKSGSEADPRSRKFSFSSQKSVEKKDRKDAKTDLSKASRAASSSTPTAGNNKSSSQPPSRPPSVLSTDGDRHKFSLEKLLNSTTTKLQRNLSARSTASSKKSDSDADKRSTAGDSSTSLSKKYGVYDRGPIGKGATSVVRLAHKWDRTEEKVYAVKEFRKKRKNETEKEYVKKLTAEFCISSTLHHVNIVETVDLIQDENKHWCEVMEFCPGGDLYAAIRKGGMSPSEVECCFKQMLTGVAYLHSQGVAHRDIKPENLFFNSRGQLKIGDYGASTVYRLPWESTVHMSSGLCGSEPYIAPEQFSCKQYDARLVDIWACGIVYYCLHFQELPWRVAQTSDPLYAAYVSTCASPNTAQSSCPPTINNLSPRACRPLIRKMLEPDPKLRWTIEEAIKFPWVESIEVCHAVSKPSHVHVYARALAREAGLQEDHM